MSKDELSNINFNLKPKIKEPESSSSIFNFALRPRKSSKNFKTEISQDAHSNMDLVPSLVSQNSNTNININFKNANPISKNNFDDSQDDVYQIGSPKPSVRPISRSKEHKPTIDRMIEGKISFVCTIFNLI